MSVRVNLLPEEVQTRGRANRSRIIAGLLGLLLLAALATATLMQRSSLNDAQDRLAQVEASNEALRADVTALQPFADLEARAESSVDIVDAALGDEKSLATIMQDLSAVLPPTAEFQSVGVTFLEGPEAPSAGGERLIVGVLEATGRVVDGLAPGVERLAIDVSRVAAFENVFVTTTTVDDEGITSFVLEAELGPEVLTDRYGLADEEEAA